VERPPDQWQSVPVLYGSVAYESLRRVQEQQRPALDEDVRFVPMLAAAHFAASRSTALEANRAGFHAVALALARQAMESLTVIEVGLLESSVANELLLGWQSGKLTQGALRKRLEQISWPQLPDTPWQISWLEHMRSLASALQPYAHYSPRLLQWNLAFVQRPADEEAIGAVGHGAFDADKAERLALLLSVFVWNLLVMLGQYADMAPEAVEVKARLDSELGKTAWLDVGQGWHDQLIPHVWFRE